MKAASNLVAAVLMFSLLLLTACQRIQAPLAAQGVAPTAAAESGAVAQLAGDFDLVQLIDDFPAGAWTPAQMHGGMLLVKVRNGELTVHDDQGVEQTYQPGESFVEVPGVYLEIGNAGESPASVATNAPLPSRAKLTTLKEGISTDNIPPGPTLLYQYKLAGHSVAAPEIIQIVSHPFFYPVG